jgi:hypothetical protein
MLTRVQIVGAGLLGALSTLLPWFREQRPDGTAATLTAWNVGVLWPVLVITLIAVFVGLALYGFERDIRYVPWAAGASLLVFVVVMTKCWVSHPPSIEGGDVDRRWGLFVALNVALALGLPLQWAGNRLMTSMRGNDALPTTTGYELS